MNKAKINQQQVTKPSAATVNANSTSGCKKKLSTVSFPQKPVKVIPSDEILTKISGYVGMPLEEIKLIFSEPVINKARINEITILAHKNSREIRAYSQFLIQQNKAKHIEKNTDSTMLSTETPTSLGSKEMLNFNKDNNGNRKANQEILKEKLSQDPIVLLAEKRALEEVFKSHPEEFILKYGKAPFISSMQR